MAKVFLHGLGQTESGWGAVKASFPEETIYTPSLRGLLNRQECTYENLYWAFCRYCDGFGEPLALCGISLGAILAFNYAIDFPERVESLVLIAAQYKMPKLLLRLQSVLFKWMPESKFEGLGFGKADFLSLTGSMAKLNFTKSLPKVSCKTLVLCGERDMANKKAALGLAKALQTQAVFVKNCGHAVNTENPAALSQEMLAFYGKLSQA